MSKIKEVPKKLEKIPTSQLIFYLSNTNISDDSKKKVEVTVYQRLTKKYKLCPEKAEKFIQRENKVFAERGQNQENYSFQEGMSREDFLKIFYENPNNLSMSEIVNYCIYFSNMKSLYEERKGILICKMKNNLDEQKKVSDNDISLNTKKQMIAELKKTYEMYHEQLAKEQEMFLYYVAFLTKLFDKISEIFDCDFDNNKNFVRIGLAGIKEGLRMPAVPLSREDKIQYRDIKFNAYEQDSVLIKKYDKSYNKRRS